jgi:hypothetical protein
MDEVAADIWVLTETRASVSPGEGFQAVHCPPHPTRREDPDERWGVGVVALAHTSRRGGRGITPRQRRRVV